MVKHSKQVARLCHAGTSRTSKKGLGLDLLWDGNVHIEGLGGLQNEPGKTETLGKRSRSNSRTFKRLMRKLTNFHRFS